MRIVVEVHYCILYMFIQVCGTDFVTYASVCALRSQNPNIRVDYVVFKIKYISVQNLNCMLYVHCILKSIILFSVYCTRACKHSRIYRTITFYSKFCVC